MTREEEIRKVTLGFVYPRCQLCNIQGICKDIVGYCIEQDSQEYGFVAGAKWADEHPKNVWHSSEEEPQGEDWKILCEDADNNHWVAGRRCGYNWEKFVEAEVLTRWAYIKDLLPKGGEK